MADLEAFLGGDEIDEVAYDSAESDVDEEPKKKQAKKGGDKPAAKKKKKRTSDRKKRDNAVQTALLEAVGVTDRYGPAADTAKAQTIMPSELYEDSVYNISRATFEPDSLASSTTSAAASGSSSNRVSLTELAQVLQGSSAYKTLQGKLSKLVKTPTTATTASSSSSSATTHSSSTVDDVLKAPEALSVVQRRQRETGYEENKGTLTKWQEIVRINRDAPQLVFPLPSGEKQPPLTIMSAISGGAAATTGNSDDVTMTSTKKQRKRQQTALMAPANEMEAEIAKLLKQQEVKVAGDGKSALEQHEEEMREQIAEIESSKDLAKMRMQMYFRQLKSARQNKIKSKTYRKLQRQKKKELLEAEQKEMDESGLADGSLDPEELAKRGQEKLLKDRAIERATLKHKGGTKWAQNARVKRLASIPGVRDALAATAALSRDKSKKITDVQQEEEKEVVIVDEDKEEKKKKNSKKEGMDDYEKMQQMEQLQQQEEKEEESERQKRRAKLNQEMKKIDPKTVKFSGKSALLESAGVTHGHHVRVSGNVNVMSDVTMSVTVPKPPKDAAMLFQEPSFEETPKTASKKEQKKATTTTTTTATVNETTMTTNNPWLKPTMPSQVVDSVAVDEAITQTNANTTVPVSQHESEEKQQQGEDDEEEGEMDQKQKALVKEAFAEDDSDVEREMAKDKEMQVEKQAGVDPTAPVTDGRLPGWGRWAGEGIVEGFRARKIREEREQQEVQRRKEKLEEVRKLRKDATMRHVIISEKPLKNLDLFKVPVAPIGLDKVQYEKSLAMPVGKEWHTATTFSKMIQPAVVTKMGKVIAPMAKETVAKMEEKKSKERKAEATKESSKQRPQLLVAAAVAAVAPETKTRKGANGGVSKRKPGKMVGRRGPTSLAKMLK